MGGHRELIVDDRVAKYWSNIATTAFELGLLVGQVSTSNVGDFVLAVVPVPSECENGKAPIGISDLSVEWVEQFAQQVDHLLPGGISVLGLYVVSTENISIQVLLAYLRATAEAVAIPSSVFAGDDVHLLALVLPNDEIVFQTFYNVTDVNKAQMLSAGIKTSTTEIKFKQYRTLIDLNEAIPFENGSLNAATTATKMADQRMNEVENHLRPLIRRIEDSVAVLGQTSSTEAQYMNLLTPMPNKVHSFTENVSIGEQLSWLNSLLGDIRGAICCVAYVSYFEPKANEVAAEFLKRDFVKSLLLRVSMVRERWAECNEVESNAVFKKGGVIRLARRGLIPWHSAAMFSRHFSATVHVFPDEDVEQAVKIALEILGNNTLNGSSWTALEIGDQLDLSFNQTSSSSELMYSIYAYTLLPIALVFALLFVQYAM
ncbi:hypothetical protein PsorP6_008211 [Peronosclerospora sorghi]|uniref:Uncharacterized protein n=1 Tax=Peronosclerospora sorghi TaxID=230839 RepID=A0ACC0W951_9STRA|nr:hypothetical protein PsorP6_008211 [Peronosclerospora sorghi]